MSKKISAKKYIEYYKECFSTEAGQIVLADLAKKYGILKPFILAGRSFDIQEGERRVILAIIQKMNYDLNALQELIDANQVEVNYERGH